jgi:hypothetical protein
MTIYGGPDIITDGLALHLDAANSKSYPGSGNTWFDLSGNSNATLINGPSFETSNAGYIKLDGSNDWCRIPFNSAFNVLSNPYTVLVWNRKDDTNNSYSGLITADSSGDQNWKIFKDINQALFKCRSGLSVYNFPNYTVNRWHCYCYTKSGSNIAIYFDGDLTGSHQNAANPASFSNDLALGSYRLNDAINGNWLMPLSFGPIMFYARDLSAQEIQQNYNALKGRFGL